MTGLPGSFPVRVCVLSDWIVGTGEGRVGDVDATVRRDHEGLPFIPAKTLTGIWRDGCEQVAAWLDGTAPAPALASGGGAGSGSWRAWVDWIFGSQPDDAGDRLARAGTAPERAQLALSPARLSGQVRDSCRDRPALRAASVVVRPGVKIDEATGVASEDMLRLEERARPGWLEARADFPFLAGPGPGAEAGLPEAAELLLRAGAAAVDAFGGKRNRGAGRCWLLPPGVGETGDSVPSPATARPADERLAELVADAGLLRDPGPPPPPRRQAAELAPIAGAADDQPAVTVRSTWRVTLEVLTPLVSQDRVLGNVVVSRDWVPGTMLLPVVLARLDRRVGHREVVVGDARPAVWSAGDAVPGRRVPMTWCRPKDRSSGRLVNAAVRLPGKADRMAPMRAGHVGPGAGGTWPLLTPELTVSTHAVIADDTGRPDSGRGGVFSYLGLAPGTLLATDVVLPADANLALDRGEVLRLGRSRKDDFGQIKVVSKEVIPPAQAEDLRAGQRVRVWCLSDVLVRDRWGGYDPSPAGLAAALARRLGTGVRAVGQEPGQPLEHAYRAARRESFHTGWNRPRPTLPGLAAGSVITVEVAGPVPAHAVAGVERDGIGERTAEGFGQVRLAAPETAVADPVLAPSGPAIETAADRAGPGGPLPAAPHVLERAAVMDEVARQVAAIVVSPERVDAVIPGALRMGSRAQWGALREQLPRLASPAGRDAVAYWLAQTRQVPRRRDTWGEPALDGLDRLITDPAVVWAALGLANGGLDEVVFAPDRAEAVRAVLWPQAVSVLVTDIARVATRRQAGPGSEESP